MSFWPIFRASVGAHQKRSGFGPQVSVQVLDVSWSVISKVRRCGDTEASRLRLQEDAS
jgi:hypothetical protein